LPIKANKTRKITQTKKFGVVAELLVMLLVQVLCAAMLRVAITIHFRFLRVKVEFCGVLQMHLVASPAAHRHKYLHTHIYSAQSE